MMGDAAVAIAPRKDRCIPQGESLCREERQEWLSVRELEENNIRISCGTFVRIQGVTAGG